MCRLLFVLEIRSKILRIRWQDTQSDKKTKKSNIFYNATGIYLTTTSVHVKTSSINFANFLVEYIPFSPTYSILKSIINQNLWKEKTLMLHMHG